MPRVAQEGEGKTATGEELAAAGHTISIGGPADSASIGFPGLLAAAPEVAELLRKPFLLSPRVLDLAERVMGPFVQGDGFYVVGTPPAQLTGLATGVASREELLAEAAGWHRDAYNHHNLWRSNPGYADDLASGGQPFTPPLAAHRLCYLQDMEGPGGPLLVVPGSHRSAQQAIDRLAERFARDIPQGLVDATDGAGLHDPVAPPIKTLHLLPLVRNTCGIFTDQVGTDVLHDGRYDGLIELLRRRFAVTVDSFIGIDAHKNPIAAVGFALGARDSKNFDVDVGDEQGRC